ncbi:hypothetical protein V5G24_13685 [Xanthobacter sp. VTT E-85241]|uniref:hypothetical protein n=1 Tax=Roseixanthobacter finlandensis TaxID=3119922 RepID=UPI00372CA24E
MLTYNAASQVPKGHPLAGPSWVGGETPLRAEQGGRIVANVMRAWQFDRLGGKVELVERFIPEPRAGSALTAPASWICPPSGLSPSRWKR